MKLEDFIFHERQLLHIFETQMEAATDSKPNGEEVPKNLDHEEWFDEYADWRVKYLETLK